MAMSEKRKGQCENGFGKIGVSVRYANRYWQGTSSLWTVANCNIFLDNPLEGDYYEL